MKQTPIGHCNLSRSLDTFMLCSSWHKFFFYPKQWLEGGVQSLDFGRIIIMLSWRTILFWNLTLSLSLGLLLPQDKKKKARGLGMRWRLPLFLTLIRKHSLLLHGEWHLLITIETLWEVPPCHTGAEICPFSLGKQATHGLVNWVTAQQTNKHRLLSAN